MHSHSAAHIMISLDDEIEIITKSEKISCRGIMIPSGISHTANTGENRVLVFLFDSTTSVANQIEKLTILSSHAVKEVEEAYSFFEESNQLDLDYGEFIETVYKYANLRADESKISDGRIKDALSYMQSNLQEPITCGEVAEHVFLSEGRFSHLFKEQVGMTFAAYLVYQRIMKTYTEIINGKSITEAAIEAGFSSSTHFAETNKRIFGLSASTIKKDLTFCKIAEI